MFVKFTMQAFFSSVVFFFSSVVRLCGRHFRSSAKKSGGSDSGLKRRLVKKAVVHSTQPLTKKREKPSHAGNWETMGRTSLPRILNICSINVRGIVDSSRKTLLEEQLSKVSWDLLAIQETKSKDTTGATTRNGDVLYNYSQNSFHGTGFIVNRNNLKNIEKFEPVSSRISFVDYQLSRNRQLRIISVYAPTCAAPDCEFSVFLEDLSGVLRRCPSRTFPVIIGDLNAKLGSRQNHELSVGTFGIGERNDRGQTVIDWAEFHHLKIFSTFFKKRPSRLWTWRSPNGQTFNQIDHVIAPSNARFQDVSVVNSFNFDSDHRMIRAKLYITPRKRKVREPKKIKIISRPLYEYGLTTTTLELDDDLVDMYHALVNKIRTSLAIATAERPLLPFMSATTKQALRDRQIWLGNQTIQGRINFVNASKFARLSMREDIRKRQDQRLMNAMRKGKSIKRILKNDGARRDRIIGLENSNGTIEYNIQKIAEIVKMFYNKLYADVTAAAPVSGFGSLPVFLESEISNVIKSTKTGTSPGLDYVTSESLKWGAANLASEITMLFNTIIAKGQLPTEMLTSTTKLLYKKGNEHNIANYRPITLLSCIFKVLSKCLLNRMRFKVEQSISHEQLGFRQSYGTRDNLHIVRQIIEKSEEYRMPLFLCFLDISKAFDTVTHHAIWTALSSIGVENDIISLLQKIYAEAKAKVSVNGVEMEIEINRGVRQGDTISPQLFTLTLDYAVKKLNWEKYGIRINGTNITHLLFADDCILFARNKKQLSKMVREFRNAISTIGLAINANKSQYLNNQKDATPLKIEGTKIHPCTETTYLGSSLSLPMNWDREINRRVSSGWAAFNENRSILKSRSFPLKFKRKLFETTILPRLLYGCESWAITKNQIQKLQVTQRKMERALINVKVQDRIRNEDLRKITKLKDIAQEFGRRKFKYCSRLAADAEGWPTRVTVWQPLNRKRRPGRPLLRWQDQLVQAVQSFNRQQQRGRLRPERLRGAEFLRISTRPELWKAIMEHHIIQM